MLNSTVIGHPARRGRGEVFAGECGEGGKVEEREGVLEVREKKGRHSSDGAHVFRFEQSC